MPRQIWKFIWGNLNTLILAFALAFAVWISAVVAADPNEQRVYPQQLLLSVDHLDSQLLLLGSLPDSIDVELSAPNSLWDRIASEANALKAFVDLSGLGSGQHLVTVQVESSIQPVRMLTIDPPQISIILEPLESLNFSASVQIMGEVALGFQIEESSLNPVEISVSGPASLIAEIDQIVALVNVSGARESLVSEVSLVAHDSNGDVIGGLSLLPSTVLTQMTIAQAGGYREVAVAVETNGQPAQGFRVIDISVSPPIVTLFSDDIQLIEGLPGFVSTLPLDLSEAQENIISRLALNLPDGVSVEGEQQNVEVRIGIAPIESSIPITVIVEIIGLPADTIAEISPESVNLILSGPLAILESLAPGDVRLLVDVSELDAGAHLLGPKVEILPEDIQVLSITPSSVEIVISVTDSQ